MRIIERVSKSTPDVETREPDPFTETFTFGHESFVFVNEVAIFDEIGPQSKVPEEP